MVITKREDVTKQGFCKLPLLWRKNSVSGEVSLYEYVLIQIYFNFIVTQVDGVGVGAN